LGIYGKCANNPLAPAGRQNVPDQDESDQFFHFRPAMNTRGIMKEFRARLMEMADAERAVQEKRYLKSPHEFIGVSKPKMTRMAREFFKQNKNADIDEVVALCDALWRRPTHEEKSVGLAIAEEYAGRLEPRHLDVVERWIRECVGWAHLDDTAVSIVGRMLLQHPELYDRVVSWSDSEILWRRRASLIAHILPLRADVARLDLFLPTCEKLLHEKEFFIRKAIGWSLREMAKRRPGEVYAFCMKVRGRASGLTLREACKRLDEKQRKEVLGK
jgi:3-methyladenine DNA glycosylase AlkD